MKPLRPNTECPYNFGDTFENPWPEMDFMWHLLERWHEMRPNLYMGQCPYGRSLLCRAIDLCQEAIDLDDDAEKAQRILVFLLSWLTQRPPPTSPPAMARPPAGFSFAHLAW